MPLSRRGFVRNSLALFGAAGLPAWYAHESIAAEQEKPKPPADRLQLGIIGVGSPQSRGLQIFGDTRGHASKPQFRGVCDVDNNHLGRAVTILQNHGHREVVACHDFRDLNSRPDIDAVMIATPDQWHALVAIDAMKKGKDVYCEKPLTLTVEEALALVKVARATDCVFQTGNQQRSDARFRLACSLVRNGRLGAIQRVECRINKNPTGTFKPAKVPEGLDWDMWQGPTPDVEFVPQRCHYEFRWWYEYSGGKMTDWGAHHLDIAQWALGKDGTGPIAVEGHGDAPPTDPHSYNVHPKFEVTYTYPEGTKVIAMCEGENGVRFEGENGRWLFVSRSKIEASDPKIIDEPLPRNAKRLPICHHHQGDWLDCIRSRKRPICDVEIGASSVIICHIGVITLRLGKSLRWDPKSMTFDDSTANAMLSRPMRAPWKLEV